MANVTGKDTIYIDIDDEITAIIEKVRGADQKIVALVLPKRATVLQSIVNMKLLKRTSDDAKKQLVLITSEASLLPLAGNVGLHVASTLQSKPAIPHAPEGPGDEPEDIDEPLDMADDEPAKDNYDPAADADKPIGQLAGVGATAPQIDDSFELDNSDGALGDAATAADKPKPAKKNKKLKIPNFDSFRNKALLGAGVLTLLIVGWIFAFVVLPKATITIHTNSSTVSTNVTVQVDTAATKLDTDGNVLPGTAQTVPKSFSQQVPATGQKNNGQIAGGSVSLSTSSCSGKAPAIPQGTGVSSGGMTFYTTADVTLTPKLDASLNCYYGSSVNIKAIRGGTAYNITITGGQVNGFSNVTAGGSASGGTDQIIKVVTQADIDAAKAKISANDTTAIKQDLQNGLTAKALLPMATTFAAGDPQVTTSANAGDQTDNVTVTEAITYSMLGVKKADLQALVAAKVKSHIDSSKQVILENGADTATFTVQDQASPNKFSLAMSAKSVAGPEIKIADIKKQVAGKKAVDIRDMLRSIPGVNNVDVKYSPFWVSNTPSNAAKITVQIIKSGS
ncbi:MAG: hypothetical protein WC498_00420 [Candidatus Saccharimonadales bacterium]